MQWVSIALEEMCRGEKAGALNEGQVNLSNMVCIGTLQFIILVQIHIGLIVKGKKRQSQIKQDLF